MATHGSYQYKSPSTALDLRNCAISSGPDFQGLGVEKRTMRRYHSPGRGPALADPQWTGALFHRLSLLIVLSQGPLLCQVNSALILCTKHRLKGMPGAVGRGLHPTIFGSKFG